MNRPIHFEILAGEPEKIASFYEDVFGWKTSSWPDGEQAYWLVRTGQDAPGIDGGIMGRHFEQAVINTVQVASIEGTIAKVEASGGKKVHGPEEIPQVGTHAYCADPEGNLFGILQPADGGS